MVESPPPPRVQTSMPPPAGASVPRTPEALTPTWMTACLRHAGVLVEGSVVGVARERIGVGRGFAGELYRLRLTYDRAEPSAPATVVAKLGTSHASTREMMVAVGGYLKEVRFYRELAADVPMPKPRCYLAHCEPSDQSFLLVLEDLAPAAAPELEAGLSVAQARETLTHFARMHARFWNRTDGLEWLRPSDAFMRNLRDFYLAGLDPFAARFEASFPRLVDAARQIGWVLRGDEYLIDFRRPPQTLTHADAHLENLFFPTPDGAGRFALVDWQSAALTRFGATDVTRILVLGLRPQTRRAHEHELLAHYHAELCAHGVRDYGLRTLHARYRREMASQLLVAVIAFHRLDLNIAGADKLTDLFVRRIDEAVRDLGMGRELTLMIWLLRPIRPFFNLYRALVGRSTPALPAG